jgi:hypothetical protein
VARWRQEEEYVPSPTIRALGIGVVHINFGAVAKRIAILVHSSGELIVQGNPINAELRERVKFVGLGDAIVIGINP